MVKLTDTQLIVLSKAAAREDGAAVVPLKMNKAAASGRVSSCGGKCLPPRGKRAHRPNLGDDPGFVELRDRRIIESRSRDSHQPTSVVSSGDGQFCTDSGGMTGAY
jgi:hypothetical protein